MDINEFEWDILEKKQSFWKATMWRLLFLIPLFAGVSYGIVWFARNQHDIKVSELIIVLEILAFVLMIIINQVWHAVVMALPPDLIHCKISADGLARNKKNYPLSIFNNSACREQLAKLALPYTEWRQPRPYDGKALESIFLTNQGKIKLEFPEEYIRQRVIRALQEYTNPAKVD